MTSRRTLSSRPTPSSRPALSSRRARTARVTVVASAVLLLASCGTRVKSETTANGGGLSSGASASTVPGSGGAGVTFGTVESPCGPNSTGAPLTGGETGITADAITITTISDPGGPKPGLNQGVFDSMLAFTDWCNAQGGVNGRKLKLEQRDAKLLEYKNRVLEACLDSFALVGGIGVFDDQGVDDAIKCDLVNVPASTVSDKASSADRMYQPLPFDPNRYAIGSAEWVKKNYPDAVKAAGSFYSAFNLVEYQNRRWVEAYKQDGFNFIERKAANVNEAAWGPLVSAMKNSNVKYLTLTSSFEEVVPLQKEMNLQGYKPDIFELETSFYDQKYPSLAKDQGIDTANTFVKLTVWPFEEADGSPAMKTYLEELKKAGATQPAELGVQAWSAGLLFATAAKKAGPNLTRDGLLAALKDIHEWDGGGLHGPTDPGAKTPSVCFIMMKVGDGTFTRSYPLADKDKDVYDNKQRPGMACPDNSLITYNNPPKAS